MSAELARVPLPVQAMFSDLEQRAHDAHFAETFHPAGSFLKRKRHNRYYWYWQRRDGKKVTQKYVGSVTDRAVSERVERFQELKSDYDQRREIVRALIAAGLPKPNVLGGEIIEAMAMAGFFRLRGVLVGTAAFQTYAGILGVKLPNPTVTTQDADFAQYFAIANMIDDSMPPVLEVLQTIDTSFKSIPHLSGGPSATSFRNADGFKVEFLTPNSGSNDYEGKPAPMKALGTTAAEPLRFLDYLIRQPTRTVLLHGGGVPVTVPTPERFAIHKLIVAERRHSVMMSKIEKDIAQASALIAAMHGQRFVDLSAAWQEAWERGQGWREALINGLSRLDEQSVRRLGAAVRKGARRRRKDFLEFWPKDVELDAE